MFNVRTGTLLGTFFLYFSASAFLFAQTRPVEAGARSGIDAGNQAWIDGMRRGDAGIIAATYTGDAVDCSPEGTCVRGRSAIEAHLKKEISELGKAQSASVASAGSVQQGRYVYEWGQAEASFPNGKKIVDRYLTAWRREPNGSWRIFRNLVIPAR